jgi:hypothetical protein
MGGDEVYPTPSTKLYRDRTTGPYEAALQFLEPVGGANDVSATLYAIPGNHDWYDGLSAFLKQFCSRQWIGGWKTRQHRSYFAIQLPHGWWLWGIDIAFDTPIDSTQMKYFREAARVLDPGDSVILATAKPSWKDCERVDDDIHDEHYNNLRYFVAETIGEHSEAEVRLMLAGDKHFYARFSEQGVGSPDARQKIIAGGGGAYLSSTAGLRDCVTVREPTRSEPGPGRPTAYELVAAWPSKDESRRLAWHALWRLPQTTRLYGALGVIVAGLAWLIRRALDDTMIAGLPGMDAGNLLTEEAARSLRTSEAARILAGVPVDGAFLRDAIDYGPVWLAVTVMAVMLLPFARKGSSRGGRPLTWLLAATHALGYVAAALVSMAVASRAAVEEPFASGLAIGMITVVVVLFWITETAPLIRVRKFATPMFATSLVVVAWIVLVSLPLNHGVTNDFRTTTTYIATLVIVGGFLGTAVLSLYLIVASLLGRNLNELFTAVRSEQYKNFVRLMIDGDGMLHAWTLGVRDPGDRILRWDPDGNLFIDGVSAEDSESPSPELIDHVTISPTRLVPPTPETA